MMVESPLDWVFDFMIDFREMIEDPHWNSKNMLYGSAASGQSSTPNRLAIMQSGNLYAYAVNDPVMVFYRATLFL